MNLKIIRRTAHWTIHYSLGKDRDTNAMFKVSQSFLIDQNNLMFIANERVTQNEMKSVKCQKFLH